MLVENNLLLPGYLTSGDADSRSNAMNWILFIRKFIP
jgi:hypothetical protein